MIPIIMIGVPLLVVFLVLIFLRKTNHIDKQVCVTIVIAAIGFAIQLLILKPWLWIK